MQLAFIIAGLVLILAPNFAATPDGPDQAMFSQGFEALALFAMAIALIGKAKRPADDRSQSKLTALSALFLGWIVLSLVSRIVSHHGSMAYVDVMLSGLTYFSSCAALFLLCRSAASAGTVARLVLIGIMVAAASITSGIGLNQYVTNLHDGGDPNMRIFSTSTPDFLAGYLVMVVPVTLALLLAGPKSLATYAGLGLCMILEVATILMTASRFALVSLALSLIVFAVLSAYSKGLEDGHLDKRRYLVSGSYLAVLLGACLVLPPIRKRLLHPDKNSGDFRIWTWKGTLNMIGAHPVFGSGIDTYVYTYPRFALTGFTRLAHEAYLQIAAEAGIPALLLLVAFFAIVLITAVKHLAEDSNARRNREPVTTDMWNPRIIHCGIIACAVAGMVQNLIDSDLYVFSCATGLFAVLGLAAGFRQQQVDMPTESDTGARRRGVAAGPSSGARKSWTVPRIAATATACGLCVLACFNTLGAWNARSANAALPNQDQGAEASSYYQTAMQLCPLNGQYPSDFGYKVTFRIANNPAGAENDLRNAVSLRPEEVSYRRLSEILAAEGKPAQALTALDLGLQQSPNDLDLLMRRAQMSPPAQAVVYYQRIADLEMTPVGTVRALDAIEVNFAIADASLADAKLVQGNAAEAITYYKRSVSTLQAYFKRGGGHDAQQMILRGGFDGDREKMLQATLDHCTSQLQALQANTTAPGQIKVQ